jgi:Flp pilus assembly protein TadD
LKQDHQVKRAIADYCKAIQLDANSPEFFNNRGLLYLENNETQKAVTDFSSAVDLDPNYTIAKHNLTLAQERLRR